MHARKKDEPDVINEFIAGSSSIPMQGRQDVSSSLERLQLVARQTLVLHDEGAIWFEDAWSKTSTHLRMRLAKSPRPIIMVESKAPYGIVAANRGV